MRKSKKTLRPALSSERKTCPKTHAQQAVGWQLGRGRLLQRPAQREAALARFDDERPTETLFNLSPPVVWSCVFRKLFESPLS